MARPKSVNRPIEKKLSLDPDLVAKTELLLFSDLEGRVPYGAWSGLIEQLLREHFSRPERIVALAQRLQAAAGLNREDPELAHLSADRAMVDELTALGYDLSARKWISNHCA